MNGGSVESGRRAGKDGAAMSAGGKAAVEDGLGWRDGCVDGRICGAQREADSGGGRWRPDADGNHRPVEDASAGDHRRDNLCVKFGSIPRSLLPTVSRWLRGRQAHSPW
jgi:hypothetical protein